MFIDQHLYKCQKNSCMRSQLTTVITIIVVFIMVIFMIDDRQSWTMWSTTLRSLLTMRGVRSTSAFHIPQTRFTFTDHDCFCRPNLTFWCNKKTGLRREDWLTTSLFEPGMALLDSGWSSWVLCCQAQGFKGESSSLALKSCNICC